MAISMHIIQMIVYILTKHWIVLIRPPAAAIFASTAVTDQRRKRNTLPRCISRDASEDSCEDKSSPANAPNES